MKTTSLLNWSLCLILVLFSTSPAFSLQSLSQKRSASIEGLGKFTVQLAAFDQESQAKALVSELKDKGVEAFYVPVKLKSQIWYRVNSGLFATENKAKIYRGEISKKVNASDFLIRPIE